MCKLLLQTAGAITIAAGPRLGPVFVAAILTIVCVFNFEQVEILLPVRAFLREWRGTKAGLNPMSISVDRQACVLHVMDIFVAGDRATSNRRVLNILEKCLFAARLKARFDEVTHTSI